MNQTDAGSPLHAYREKLLELEQQAQQSYDKTIVTLSGGALGLSLVFYEKVAGATPEGAVFLFLAWGSWALSLLCVLFSFYFSAKALRKAVEQVDRGQIFSDEPGGASSQATRILNIGSGVFFLLGVLLMIAFAAINLGV